MRLILIKKCLLTSRWAPTATTLLSNLSRVDISSRTVSNGPFTDRPVARSVACYLESLLFVSIFSFYIGVTVCPTAVPPLAGIDPAREARLTTARKRFMQPIVYDDASRICILDSRLVRAGAPGAELQFLFLFVVVTRAYVLPL